MIGQNMYSPNLGNSGSSFSCEHTTGCQYVSISYINDVGDWIKSLNTSEVSKLAKETKQKWTLSPSCRSKPLRLAFLFKTQAKHF